MKNSKKGPKTTPLRKGKPPIVPKRSDDRPASAEKSKKSPFYKSPVFKGVTAVVAILLVVVGLAVAAYKLWPQYSFDSNFDEPNAPQVNAKDAPGSAPEGMVWIPGGYFYRGIRATDFQEGEPMAIDLFNDARPVHKVYVDGFWMDVTEVTNAQFAKFVEATGYKTSAELPPDPKDFPGYDPKQVPKEPISLAFNPNGPIDLRNHMSWWAPKKGVSWKHPTGPGSSIEGRENHPVTCISYRDALAYCKWAKRRLPTEAEWEFAARGGLHRKRFIWGNEKEPKGNYLANYWQGKFPKENTEADGFYGTSPVKSYKPNKYGLYDMAGNVWEWCSDWYRDDYYSLCALNEVTKNPKGPSSYRVPGGDNFPRRVQRGGSYLCADNYCMRYLPGARGKGDPIMGLPHVGFRCVKDPK